MNRRLNLSIIVAALLVAAACASAPKLSPQGAAAFHGTQVIHGLDLLRDTAIAAHDQQPPLMSEATTRKVVLYHKSALTVIHAVPGGWMPIVQAGLDEVLKDLPPNESKLLAPYVALVNTVIHEVVR